ncbi:ATP-binding protein [Maricaulis sp.]|uniref:sensor histidine kinase n=1 Tax=Maricaulis sp. TaxID=1486257 RepID=UPI003A8D6F50
MKKLPSGPLITNVSPRSAALFGIGFLLSLTVVVLTAIAILGDGAVLEPGDRLTLAILVGNCLLLFALASVVFIRLRRRMRGRRFGEPAPRLHLRFVGLFSLAATAPAIFAAMFLGLILTRGVEYWFGEQVSSFVDTASRTAQDVYYQEANVTRSRLTALVSAIDNEEAATLFTSSRIQYNTIFASYVARAQLAAAYIVDARGARMAEAEFRPNEVYIPPTPDLYERAEEGGVGTTGPLFATRAGIEGSADAMRMLFRLENYEGAYLYVSREMDMSLWRDILDASESLRTVREHEGEARVVFFLLYAEVVALIVIGSLWLALSAATRVVTPISRLVAAAERVRRGDLDARVQMGREDDEISALGRAFNRMTRQLRSQRRELIASHAESEQRRAFTEAVLAGVSAGVLGVDGENRVRLINRSAVGHLSPGTDDLVGARIDDIAPELSDIVAQARRRPGYVAEAQIDLKTADEQVRYLSARATMDEEAGLIITFDDVTRLVTAQRNAAWREVARRIAHEIKNPLTPIQLSAERIKRKYRKEILTDVETFDRCTDTIIRQVSDIGRMVDEFSSFARMPEPKVEPVEMSELTQAATFAQRVATPSVDTSFKRPERPIHALCDARLSSQALANILKNAAESVIARMESGVGDDTPGQIRVSLREEDGYAVIEVCDNGLGWPTANRERLTEPYMTTREKGTGLGLAIVKRVMEDHKGRLELGLPESGQGAVVRLVFPLAEEPTTDLPTKKEA